MAAILCTDTISSSGIPIDITGPLIRSFNGRVVRDEDSSVVVWCASAADALECGLAIQSRLAARNRSQTTDRLTLRMAIDCVDSATPAAVPDRAIRRAGSIAAQTPGGRIFVPRDLYLQARNAGVFAFIPLGTLRIAISEDVELFEVLSVAGRGWRLAGQALPSITTLESAGRPVAAPRPVAMLPNSAVGWLLAAALSGVLFMLQRPVSALLSPLQIVVFVFHLAGATLFGLGGSEAFAALGGLVVPIAMPWLALIHYASERKHVALRCSMAWAGHSLLSLGVAGLSGTDPESLAGVQRAAFISCLRSIGALGVAHQVALTVVFAGCATIALTVAAGLTVRSRTAASSVDTTTMSKAA